MVIGTLLTEGTDALRQAGVESPRLDAEVLLAHLLQKERLYLSLHRTETVLSEIARAFRGLIARRAAHEPIAYLTGHKEFMSLDFQVGPGVLIPRPDTETLVELVIANFEKKKNISVLDLCTGSGAIAVSLAYYLPESRVTAYDISSICVETARHNAAQNGVGNRVMVEKKDVLQPLEAGTSYDCVVSNPPYIPAETVASLETDVRDYEPRSALDGGADGLLFYRHFAAAASPLLVTGGLLALETGHDQAAAVAALLKETGCFGEIGIHRDLAGIDRVVCGKRL